MPQKKLPPLIGTIMLALLAGAAGMLLRPEMKVIGGTAQKPTESVYERVMRTKTLRCGYASWLPIIGKDPATGKVSGIFQNYMEALGHALQVKIEWTEEPGTGSFITALQTGRIDAMCAGIWPNAVRARHIDFIRPIYYSPIYAYARTDDPRFDNNLSGINRPSITIVSMDGEMAELIAASDYPKARRIELPQGSDLSGFFMNIAMKKADLTFTDPSMFALYAQSHPGILKRVPTKDPIRVFGNTIAIASGEDQFRRMLDTATEELILNGKIEMILNKYKPYSDTLMRVSSPYEAAK